jgi:transcriptional regulator with XRE-family HTH domain
MSAPPDFAARLRWWRRRRAMSQLELAGRAEISQRHLSFLRPVLPMRFQKGDVSLDLFTTIATLGTPQDITLQELRIESFFPMDEQTAAVLRAWAAAS